MMKKYFLILLTSVLITAITHAQPPAKDGAPPPPPDKRERPQIPPDRSLQTVTSYNGKVVKMAINDDYVYDGFYLLNNNDSLLVKFPPHLGTQIMSLVKQGATVSVNGVLNSKPNGEKEVKMLSVTASGKTIVDTASQRLVVPADAYTSGSGTITALQTNREGNVTGFVIDNKTILRVPPHASSQLGNLVKANTSVAYTGMKKETKQGEAVAQSYTIVHCKTITVNGQQYLL